MARFIRLTLLAFVMIGVGSLVVGGLGAVTPVSGTHSPYVSAISDVSVKPAEAVVCNQLTCFYHDNPGHKNDGFQCDDFQEFGTHCLLVNGGESCNQITPCPM